MKPEPLGFVEPRLQRAPLSGTMGGVPCPIELPKGVIGVLFVYGTREEALAAAGPENAPGVMAIVPSPFFSKAEPRPDPSKVMMMTAAALNGEPDTREPGLCELCGRPASDVRGVQFRDSAGGFHDKTLAACRSCRTRRHGKWRYAVE